MPLARQAGGHWFKSSSAHCLQVVGRTQVSVPSGGRKCGSWKQGIRELSREPRNGSHTMARSARIPKYRRHSSGQARVTLDGKDHLLGPYNSAESKEAYRRLIAEWTAGQGRFAPKEEAKPFTVNELILAHWKWAVAYFHWDKRGGQCLKDALGVLRELYGRT